MVAARLDPTPGAGVYRVRIEAPPPAVWPWLCQMMRGGGLYGWPALESNGCRSSERLIDDVPPPRVGDRADELFVLCDVEPGRRLVWRAGPDLELLGFAIDELVIDYELCSIGYRSSSLTAYTTVAATGLTVPVKRHLLGVIGALLPQHQLARIKRLAEGDVTPRQAPPGPHSEPAPPDRGSRAWS